MHTLARRGALTASLCAVRTLSALFSNLWQENKSGYFSKMSGVFFVFFFLPKPIPDTSKGFMGTNSISAQAGTHRKPLAHWRFHLWHIDEAFLGLSEEGKVKVFFYFWRTSWKLMDWTEKAPEECSSPAFLFTAETLPLTRPRPPPAPNITFAAVTGEESLTWFDNSWADIKRGFRTGTERKRKQRQRG